MTRIGIAIDPREPFGLYTLAMIRSDSDRAIKPHVERRKRIQQWAEFGMTLTTMLLASGVIGFCTLNTIGV